MRKLTLLFFILSAGMLILASCQKEITGTIDTTTPPGSCVNNTNWLKNGHQLIYKNYPIYLPADTLYSDFTEVSTGIFKGTSKFDDGLSFPSVVSYLQVCGNSVYQSEVSTMANKQEIYRLDGNVGDSWNYTVNTVGGSTVVATNNITAKNVSVTVPKGTFTCLKIHNVSVANGLSIESDEYFTPQYGPVKIEGSTTHYELARTNF